MHTKDEIEVQEVEWAMLEPHAKRGALYLLDGDEDLEAVGIAIRDDDVARIRGLLENGALATRVPDSVDAEARYRFVIVQPYVVAQGPLS